MLRYKPLLISHLLIRPRIRPLFLCYIFLSMGCSTSGADKSRTKRSVRAKRELGPAAAAAHLQSTGGTVFRNMVTTSGRVLSLSASSGGQVLKQESRPQRRHSDTAWMVLTKLRANLGLTIATMA